MASNAFTNFKASRVPQRMFPPFGLHSFIWVVVKMMVPFVIPIIIRHLIFRVPKKGP